MIGMQSERAFHRVVERFDFGIHEDKSRFTDAVKRALALHPYHSRWLNLQRAGMARDFSWPTSARKYFELYKKLVEQSASPVANGILRERLKDTQ